MSLSEEALADGGALADEGAELDLEELEEGGLDEELVLEEVPELEAEPGDAGIGGEELKEETVQEATTMAALPEDLKSDIKSVLSYLDQLLESLPEEKIREFANSDYFGTYKRLFDELGLES